MQLIHTANEPYHGTFPVIDDNRPWEPAIKNFIELSYAGFTSNRSKFRLDVFLEYYLNSKRFQAFEMGILSACIALESLKDNYKEIMNLPEKISFRDALIKLYSKYGFTNESFDFIDIRNQIVHKGISNKQLSMKTLLEIWNKIDRIFMKIVRYTGPYLDCRNQFAKTTQEGENLDQTSEK
jgi:hypothetical protein